MNEATPLTLRGAALPGRTLWHMYGMHRCMTVMASPWLRDRFPLWAPDHVQMTVVNGGRRFGFSWYAHLEKQFWLRLATEYPFHVPIGTAAAYLKLDGLAVTLSKIDDDRLKSSIEPY